MTAKEHYDNHLGNFYSWMVGDFMTKQQEHYSFLSEQNIRPLSSKIAIDLGAGHGISSISLAKLGYNIKAIDFNEQLLTELQINSKGLSVDIFKDDIRSIKKYSNTNPELIICWGDTLTHLDNIEEVIQLVNDCCKVLLKSGKLILSFRDYSSELLGDNRFIPVKADDSKILTCCLDYEPSRVRVTDLLYYKTENGWEQKVSSYYKVRLSPGFIVETIRQNGLSITFNNVVSRMITIIATKQ